MRPFLVALLFLSFLSAAGQEGTSPIVKFLIKKGYTFPDSVKTNSKAKSMRQWPDTLYYNTPYKSTLLGSMTVPISFSSFESTNGQYAVITNISLGLGYTWFWGDFIFNEDDKITVDTKAFFGIVANAGLGTNFSINKPANLFAGGFIGIGSVTLLLGYDILNNSISIGLGGRIDLFTISNKFLHMIGKVHEVRRHKKIASPITQGQ